MRADADRVDIPPRNAAFNTANMQRGAARRARRARHRARERRRCRRRGSRAPQKIVEATYSTPYLPRARMEPGNATVLVTDNRVDIWIGDQSPQETRFSAAPDHRASPSQRLSAHVPSRRRLRPQRQRSAGRARDHDRERESRHADSSALDARGGLHRHDLSRDGRRAAYAPRSTRTAGRIALDVRIAMQKDGFGPDASFDVASRYFVPSYRFSNHTTNFHVPVGTRRGVGQAAHEFYRESFMNELAHAAGKDPYRYRRELIARTSLPFKNDMIKALDIAAEMSGWGKPLPKGTARAHRARRARRRDRRLRDDQRDGAHRVREPRRQGTARARRRRARPGLRPGEPFVREEADRGPDHVVLQRRDASSRAHRRMGASTRTTSTASVLSRIDEDPPEIDIRFFATGHWLIGMGHDRGTSVQSAIGDAVFQITGKRYRDLPYRQHDLTWS